MQSEVPNAEQIRLHMGELTADEVRIAQAAYWLGAQQAEAKLALAEQDARRLDWLCANALFLVLSSKVSRGRDPEVIKPTRDAIDAAIDASGDHS